MKSSSKKILITGATGFVGKHLIPKLVKYFDKKQILCLIKDDKNNLEDNGREIIKKFGVETQKVNLVTGKGLDVFLKNPKLIIHLAATTDSSNPDHRVNDLGTRNLYRALGKLGPQSHFIHVSTMVIVSGRLDCSSPIDEETPDCPTNEYTRTKLAGEKYLSSKCQENKFRLTILKPNTIYGKGVRLGSLFDILKKMILKESLITKINWPGKSALIHVEDVVDAILLFSKMEPKPGIPEKYLLYSENLSIAEMSGIMHKEMGIVYKPINLPQVFWKTASWSRRFVPYFEKFLPPKFYNHLWRASLIVDDVVCCKTDKAFRKLYLWKPKKLNDTIKEIVP